MTQLTTLNLGYNQITDEDAKALANLTNLTSLNLMDNNITDLTFVTNLTALTSLNVSQDADNPNKITSLKPLTKLVNLSIIMLDNNNISDLSPLRNITAIPQIMSLNGNHIFDIMPVLSLNWQPFTDPEQPFYNIGADYQTWTLDQVTLNPATQHLSTWSFAYDNLHDFNEFMDSDPQSPATAKGIGAGNWTVWSDLSQPEGTLKLVWDVSRHNDYRRPVAPDGLRFSGTIMVPYTLQAGTGAVTVDFQLDGGVEIAPFVILSGQTGSGLDVLTDASVQQTIAELEDRDLLMKSRLNSVQILVKQRQIQPSPIIVTLKISHCYLVRYKRFIWSMRLAMRLVRSWSRRPAKPGVLGRRLFQQLRGTNTIESWVPQPWQINN
ncbi:leucine-rich repeat domain-containing protein [Levilactobacillus brevis]|nr:leucine-rich repeat domain-containing protein [Levilactobacillus brevis]